jgi:hypothetical protein
MRLWFINGCRGCCGWSLLFSNIMRWWKFWTSYRRRLIVFYSFFSWSLVKERVYIIHFFHFFHLFRIILYLWRYPSSLDACRSIASMCLYKRYKVVRTPDATTARTCFCWEFIFGIRPEDDYSSIIWNRCFYWLVYCIHNLHFSPIIDIWIYTLYFTP